MKMLLPLFLRGVVGTMKKMNHDGGPTTRGGAGEEKDGANTQAENCSGMSFLIGAVAQAERPGTGST